MKPPISFSLIVIFTIYLAASSNSQSPVAINPERNKFLGEALSWLTLRVQGKPLSGNILEETTEVVRDKYRASRLFRTIVIAFQLGVLPKLTLQHGQPCDPAYTLLYKNSFNNSVTYEKIRSFTLQNYYDLEKPGTAYSGPYCDSRQGLVCLPTTEKCDCPEGSKMGPIEDNSPVQRCLLEENQPCQLMDLSVSPNVWAMAGRIAESIFNLEKPQSCKWGTECAVKNTKYPTCLSSTKGPFSEQSPGLKYGEECVLDFVGDSGGCEPLGDGHWLYPFSTCFNYWGYLSNKSLPSTRVSRLMGFCASEGAPYISIGAPTGIQNPGGTLGSKDYFVTPFVNQRTVPMALPELIAYDKELHQITSLYMRGYRGRRARSEGQRCSVADTTKLLEVWYFYAGLEKNPPAGQDFVADEATLNTKLEEYKNLLGDRDQEQPKFCRVTWENNEMLGTSISGRAPPLICVTTGATPDTNGNDGTCQVSTNMDTFPYAERTRNFHAEFSDSKRQSYFDSHDSDILLRHPEGVQCTPKTTLGKLEDNDIAKSHHHGEVLEDGNCKNGYACMEDFNDMHEIYFSSCEFKPGYQPQYFCIDVSSRHIKYDYGGCERRIVGKKVENMLRTVSKLERGAKCKYEEEQFIAEYFKGGYFEFANGYRLLALLERNVRICDPTKLLECTKENTCECVKNSGLRESADKKHTSEHCYLTSGSCRTDVTGLITMAKLDSFNEAIKNHYGHSIHIESECKNGNICLFIDVSDKSCTTENTGKTGVDVEVEETTTTGSPETEEPTEPGEPEEPEEPDKPSEPNIKPLKPVNPFSGAETSLKKPGYVGGTFMMIIYLLIST